VWALIVAGMLIIGGFADGGSLCVPDCAWGAPAEFDDVILRKPWADVRAFGAKGDGEADDTVAIQAAINFSGPRHSVVYLPRGAYRITSRLRVPPNVSLEGVGVGFGSTIKAVATDAITIVGKDHVGGFGFRNRIKSLNITMTGARGFTAVRIDSAYSVKLEDVFVFDAGTGAGVVISNARHVNLENVSVYGNGSGDGIRVNDSDVRSYDVNVEGVVNGIVVNASRGVHVFGGHIERFGAYGIRFDSSSFNSVTGVRFSGSNNGTIAVGFRDAGKGPSRQNTIMGSLLTNPAPDATAVYQDASSDCNMILNSLIEGAIKAERSPVTVVGAEMPSGTGPLGIGQESPDHLSGAFTLNFGAPTRTPQSLDLTVPLKGAALGDPANVGSPVSVGAEFILTAFVSAPDVLTIRWTQLSGRPTDPDGAGGIYRVDVWKP
jgi:hypothetical protein